MIFWFAAAVLAAALAALIMLRAAGASRAASAGAEDPAALLYRRQLTELDELANRGVLNEEDRRTAFAEAGRRLLSTRDGAVDRPIKPVSPKAILAMSAVTMAAALGVYMVAGAPGFGDQPFAARLEQWQKADPRLLEAPQMAAVLGALVKDRPNDPQLFVYMARARLAAGDGAGGVEAARRALRLKPDDAGVLSLLGQAEIAKAGNGAVSPEAEAAFRQALALDPQDMSARYFLAQAQVERGDTAGGVAAMRDLLQRLPMDDPRIPFLNRKILEAEVTTAPTDTRAGMIEGMVAGLAQRLKSQPDDAEGWARLVRSYGVLGQAEAQQQALNDAREALAGQPDAIALVEAQLAHQ